jgi:hypothetical protein
VPKEHSSQKGARPYVLAADRFTERTELDGTETYFEGTRITLELPRDFDFDRCSKQLLARLKEAFNLFTNEPEGE